MGLFTTLFCYVLPGVGAATYLSFSLGSRLPEACRKMGYCLFFKRDNV